MSLPNTIENRANPVYTFISFFVGTIYAMAGVSIIYLSFCLLYVFTVHTTLGRRLDAHPAGHHGLGIAWPCLSILPAGLVMYLLHRAERALHLNLDSLAQSAGLVLGIVLLVGGLYILRWRMPSPGS